LQNKEKFNFKKSIDKIIIKFIVAKDILRN